MDARRGSRRVEAARMIELLTSIDERLAKLDLAEQDEEPPSG